MNATNTRLLDLANEEIGKLQLKLDRYEQVHKAQSKEIDRLNEMAYRPILLVDTDVASKLRGLEQACKDLVTEANRNDLVIQEQKKRIMDLMRLTQLDEQRMVGDKQEITDLKKRLEHALHQRDSAKQLANHMQGLAWDFHVPYPEMKLTPEVRTDKVQYFIGNGECSKTCFDAHNAQVKSLYVELENLRRDLRDLKVLSGVAKGTLMGQVLKLSAEIENLQTRIGDLEVLSSDHQKLNGQLREEIKQLTDNLTACQEDRDKAYGKIQKLEYVNLGHRLDAQNIPYDLRRATIYGYSLELVGDWIKLIEQYGSPRTLHNTLTRAQEEGTKMTLALRTYRDAIESIRARVARCRSTITTRSIIAAIDRLRGI